MNIKNYSTLTKKYKLTLSSIHLVYRLINSTFELKDLILRLSNLICQILNVKYCSILLIDSSKKYFTYSCIINNGKTAVVDRKTKITSAIYKKIAKTVDSIFKDKLLIVPLVADDIIGMLTIRKKKNEGKFEEFDLHILTTIAGQAVMGIKNLQLYEEQQRIVLGSIKSLVTLLDTKAPEATHSPYYGRLVLAIARQMNLNEKAMQGLEYASLLHDAGKVDIPTQILKKTKKLTKKEYKIVKKHPEKSAQILRPLQALRPAIPIITHHHEKFDGTGYPSGLKHNQIPIGARIMAVADALEAMYYGRPYKKRLKYNKCIKEIKKNSGTQFDPKVVDAFLNVIKNRKLRKSLHLL